MSLSCSNRNQLNNMQQLNINSRVNMEEASNNNVNNNSSSSVTNNQTTSSETRTITEIENLEVLSKTNTSTSLNVCTTNNITNTEINNITHQANTQTSLHQHEVANTSSESRAKGWQQFGAEYNEHGELISCGKEPVAGHGSGWTGHGEARDRSVTAIGQL